MSMAAEKKKKKAVPLPPIMKESIFLVGVSGSGKSYFGRNYCLGKEKFTVCVNAYDSDFPTGIFRHCEAEDLGELSDTIMIWDDLNMPSLREVKQLRDLITRTKRHSNCSILLMSHSIAANNCAPLISQMDKVIFTQAAANLDSFKRFSTTHMGNTQEEAKELWDDFMSSPPRSYFVYNMRERSSSHTDVNLRPTGQREQGSTEKFSFFRSGVEKYLSNNQGALNLFDYIFSLLDARMIESDYRIDMKDVNGEKYDCNLIDFLHNATTPGSIPSAKEKTFYKAVCQKISIPRLLIKNPLFIKHTCKKKEKG